MGEDGDRGRISLPPNPRDGISYEPALGRLVYLSPDRINFTNHDVDEMWVGSLVSKLRNGQMNPCDLMPIPVTIITQPDIDENKCSLRPGYYADDGNHRLTAIRRIGFPWILAVVRTIDELRMI